LKGEFKSKRGRMRRKKEGRSKGREGKGKGGFSRDFKAEELYLLEEKMVSQMVQHHWVC
jgi:hypothetical protein